MKVYTCSDLHCEFHEDRGRELIFRILPDADVAIVAGDLSVSEELIAPLGFLARKYEHVVFVAGNHEYYHSFLQRVEEIRREIPWANVHWLEDEAAEVEGVRFVGCTLWFGPHPADLEPEISDFRCISGLRQWVHQENHRSLEFLRRNVTSDSIVVTHHLPSCRSIPPPEAGSPVNCFYVCPEAEHIIGEQSPLLWVHGHVHHSLDYRLGNTRVLCNPRGYPGPQRNPAFQTSGLVLDL